MANTDKQYLFERMPVGRAVMTLSVPTVLSSLVMVLYSIADTYFVGMLNDPVQNAAVTLASPVLLAFNAVNNLFGVGTSSAMSRALGRHDTDTVRRSSAFGFWCAVLSGVFFSALCSVFIAPLLRLLGAEADTVGATQDYMLWTVCLGATPSILNVVMAYMVRSEGAALHASIGTMSGCFLNIILDPVFILPWGLNMGASGAGLATMISNCVACLYFFVLLYVRRGRTYVCVDPRMALPRRGISADIFGVGVPASIQNLLNVASMTLLNNFTAPFGAAAVAAMGIAHKIIMVPMQISMGFSQGIMPLEGYNYASGDIKRMKKTLLFTTKISIGFLIVVTAAFYFGAGGFIRLFMKDEEIVSIGSRLLRAFCLEIPFLCMDFTAVGIFQATGIGRLALLFAVLRKAVLEVPALLALNRLYPLYGLPYCQVFSEVTMAAAAIVSLVLLFRKWEKRQGIVSE